MIVKHKGIRGNKVSRRPYCINNNKLMIVCNIMYPKMTVIGIVRANTVCALLYNTIRVSHFETS